MDQDQITSRKAKVKMLLFKIEFIEANWLEDAFKEQDQVQRVRETV